jgi:hypothetical protein
MAFGRCDRHTIQCSRIDFLLSGQPDEAVVIALNLESVERPVDHGDIHTSRTLAEPKLIDDSGIVVSMLGDEVVVQRPTYIDVAELMADHGGLSRSQRDGYRH